MPQRTLRASSLGAHVVAMAAQGDYAAIVRLTESGVWMGEEDVDTAVAALLADECVHDVHRRRGLAAVLQGSRATRARTVLRGLAFAGSFARVLEDGRVDLDGALRSLAMGAQPMLLLQAAFRTPTPPEWTGELVRALAAHAKKRRMAWRRPDDLVDVVMRSGRPGALLRAVHDAFGIDPVFVFRSHDRMSDAFKAALLERLAEDGEFMAWREARGFVRRVLLLACRTGSERLLGAVEAVQAASEASEASGGRAIRDDMSWSTRREAERLSREHCSPDAAERVAALLYRDGERERDRELGGVLMQLVEYGAQDIGDIGRFAHNYNVLRIMSGMGGLTYTS
jgi:hypothetical protein